MSIRQFLFGSLFGRVLLSFMGAGLYYLVFAYPILSLLDHIYLVLGLISFNFVFDLNDAVGTLLSSAFWLSFLFPILSRIYYQKYPSPLSRRVMSIAMTWSGFCFFLFFPALILNIESALNLIPTEYATLLASLIYTCVLALSFIGVINARLLFVKTVDIQHAEIKEDCTAIQLSDVHIGSRSSYFINKIVDKVNEIHPNYVFITGDLVDLSSVGEEELNPLARIKAPIYFVVGNHDRYVSLDRLLPMLDKVNVNTIRNAKLSLPEFNIFGIDDAESPKQVEKELSKIEIDEQQFNILLYHRPQGFDYAASRGIDLMLSGHTHNGQIYPFNYFVRGVFEHLEGNIRIGDSLLHVSTGTSTWGPVMRIGSKNELTLINFSTRS